MFISDPDDEFNPAQLINADSLRPELTVVPPREAVASPFAEGVKRALDLLAALVLILLFLPVIIAVGIAIKLDSPGPVFFVQKRMGRYNTPFTMIKFRTMCADAEERKAELLALNEVCSDSHMYFKIRRDPRITRVGGFLRRFSIDEIPQLFNVVIGNMSLVGPRPLPGDEALHVDDYQRRTIAKPGMTGLWQVSGRSKLTAEQALKLDLYYVDNWSIWLDAHIMLRTAKAVFGSDGAY
jgi:lipopolysaccharide/colanic/teichoic acid biosynthesis glycosyltransferase